MADVMGGTGIEIKLQMPFPFAKAASFGTWSSMAGAPCPDAI